MTQTTLEAPTSPAPAPTPFIESDANASADELRARMDDQGYLFFRGLIPADSVTTVRRAVLQHCADAGWLDDSRDIMEAIAAPDGSPLSENMKEYQQVYRRILQEPSFHAFPEGAALRSIAAKILLADVLVHPRRIGRVTWPNLPQAATPPHQDFFYIRGSVETYSCWVPLGECPIELGGLAVWAGSQRRGFIPHDVESPGATGGRGVPVEADASWHASGFELGDALFFHSHTIHKALPNLTPDRMRISTDNRYQGAQDDIDPSALQPHFGLN